MQFPDDQAEDPTDDQDDDDQADGMEDDFAYEPAPTQCNRVVLRRLVDALMASLEASGIEPDTELASALDVARAELDWTA